MKIKDIYNLPPTPAPMETPQQAQQPQPRPHNASSWEVSRIVEAWRRNTGLTLNPAIVAKHIETLKRWEMRIGHKG